MCRSRMRHVCSQRSVQWALQEQLNALQESNNHLTQLSAQQAEILERIQEAESPEKKIGRSFFFRYSLHYALVMCHQTFHRRSKKQQLDLSMEETLLKNVVLQRSVEELGAQVARLSAILREAGLEGKL